jgi:hypothetical protein
MQHRAVTACYFPTPATIKQRLCSVQIIISQFNLNRETVLCSSYATLKSPRLARDLGAGKD